MEKNAIISKINSMLEDMNQTQLQNIYEYTCDEYDEEGHEGNLAQMLVEAVQDKTTLEIICKELLFHDPKEEEMETLLRLYERTNRRNKNSSTITKIN